MYILFPRDEQCCFILLYSELQVFPEVQHCITTTLYFAEKKQAQNVLSLKLFMEY